MANSTGFKMKPHEEKALAAADLRRIDLAKWSHPAGRQAFTALGNAARKLQKALQPFTDNPHSGDRSLLIGLMQASQLPRLASQSDYRNMVDGLYDPLRILNAAAIAGAGGPGNSSDPLVERWILIAAQAWIEHDCGKPSSSVSGRFFRALADFQHRNAGALSVTERQLRSAFKDRDDSGAKPTK